MYLDRGYTLHGLAGARRIVAALFIGLFSCSFAQAAETRVYLLRGWFGVFSTGMDELAAALNAQGAKAEAIGHLSWKATVSKIVQSRTIATASILRHDVIPSQQLIVGISSPIGSFRAHIP